MANDLLEREEQAAGNSDDGLNVGQKNSDATFNKKEGSHDEIEGYDRSADGLDDYDEEEFGKRKDPEYTDAHGDKVKSNYNADDPSDDIKEKEETGGPSLYSGGGGAGGGFNFQAALKGKGRNVGPTSGVVGLLLFGLVGMGGGSMGIASSLLINMKEIFHNDRSDATRTNRLFSRAFISNKVHNTKDCAGIKIKCKMSSMSKAQFDSYKKEGFKIKGDVIDKNGSPTGEKADDSKSKINDPASDDGSRVKVSEIQFPDKTTVSTGKDFFAHADKSIDARRSAERGFNSKSSFYQNRFFSKYLEDVFSFKKAQKPFPQDEKNKKDQDKAFNDQSGGMTDEENKNGGADKKAKAIADESEEHAKKGGLKGGGAVAAAVRGYCAVYRLGLIAQAAFKARLVLQMGTYALLFVQAADEIKDGRGDGPKTTYLSDNITSYEPNKQMLEDDPELGLNKGDPNPKHDLTGTDSEGYQIAAQGKKGGLQDFSKKFMASGNGVTKKIQDFTSKMASVTNLPGVKQLLGSNLTERQRMKQFCRLINGTLANLVAGCAAIPGIVGALTGPETAGIGFAVSAAIGITTCTCTITGTVPDGILQNVADFLVTAASGGSINCPALEDTAAKGMEQALKVAKSDYVQGKLADVLKNINIGSDIKGVDAGNVITAGMGAILSRGATGYAERPAKKGSDKRNQEVSNFITYTQPLEDKYIALEKDDGRLNPLDLDNKYSLVGSLARSLSLGASTPKSLYGSLATLSSLIPSSLNVLSGGTANALYNQPSTAKDGAGGRYNTCDGKDGDPDLQELDNGNGVTADTFCSIVGITPTKELDAASDQAYNPDSKNIDELTDRMLKKYQDGEGDTKPSIDQDGKPIGYTPGGEAKTEYAKFLTYCTEQRKAPWGAQYEGFDQGSDTDQKWYNGDRCLEDTPMLADFRSWTNYCLQSGTMDGNSNCYTDDAQAPAKSSACAGGGNAAIYTCALKYDNYRYLWGGGHSGNAQQFIADFNAGKTPEWTQILDCSGLVRMAFVEAMGVEDGAYTAPDGYNGSAHWDPIDVKDAVQGDIITQSGHVAIVESNDKVGELKIFDAETDGGAQEDNIRHSTASYGSVIGAFRAKK